MDVVFCVWVGGVAKDGGGDDVFLSVGFGECAKTSLVGGGWFFGKFYFDKMVSPGFFHDAVDFVAGGGAPEI